MAWSTSCARSRSSASRVRATRARQYAVAQAPDSPPGGAQHRRIGLDHHRAAHSAGHDFVVSGVLRTQIGTSIITAASHRSGAQPPMPKWPAMLNEARADTAMAPHIVVFPSLAIFFTVLAFTPLGDGLRDALDPPSPPAMIEAPYIGSLKAGPLPTIADAASTVTWPWPLHARSTRGGDRRHGRIRPHQGDVYRSKVPAAASVVNGFGKRLVQVDQLGVLEAPLPTNTFGVGTVANAQIRHAIEANSSIGREWPTVNPLVFECNDGRIRTTFRRLRFRRRISCARCTRAARSSNAVRSAPGVACHASS